MELQFGPWEVQCTPDDGARLDALRFDGVDLLTAAPADFHAPQQDYGRYEARPVYGYDDCFPTVDACPFPGGYEFNVPDHGELCWLPWDVERLGSELICRVKSKLLPMTFTRRMVFADAGLTWNFSVRNDSPKAVPFLHVMHPLMPAREITGILLPGFATVSEEMFGRALDVSGPRDVAEFLLSRPGGEANMLLLHDVTGKEVGLNFRGGPSLTVSFPREMFPTLGIWWNNEAYPDEDGCRRVECAFEPIGGTLSSLAGSFRDKVYNTAPPNETVEWSIAWDVST